MSPRGRAPRKAPVMDKDPFDEYSTWDIRLAQVFYYVFIGAVLWTVIGIWLAIFGSMVETGQWEVFAGFDLSLQVVIIAGIIALNIFLLVLFYILFRGGILRLCKVLFKDRIIAKKYEDFWTLRVLIALLLMVLYVAIIALIIWILPLATFQSLASFLDELYSTFNPGDWFLYIGLMGLAVWFIIFFALVLWNNGVYWVLKRIKTIEEEDEVKERIKTEKFMNMNDEELAEAYKKDTGKNPFYKGKPTKGFIVWKKKKVP